MLRNVEIKAKVQNLTDLLKRAKDASKSSGTILKQVDVFFHSKTGRLKLRDEVSSFIAFFIFLYCISLCCTRKTRKEKRHG
jgi:adenylate cyclase class IV